MLAGIREILIIVNRVDLDQYQRLLGDGGRLGLRIQYSIQENPAGIPDGLSLAEDFAAGEGIALILGDNVFFGSGMGNSLSRQIRAQGATIFLQQVKNPSDYGVVEFDQSGAAVRILEKPTSPPSNMAVTGLYFYDKTVFHRISSLVPSSRGELEITDLNMSYLSSGELSVTVLPRGTAWLDTGTFDGLSQASEFVKSIETRQGFLVSSPEEIAIRKGFVQEPYSSLLPSGIKSSPYLEEVRAFRLESLN